MLLEQLSLWRRREFGAADARRQKPSAEVEELDGAHACPPVAACATRADAWRRMPATRQEQTNRLALNWQSAPEQASAQMQRMRARLSDAS
jgi:hypothetical protein